MDENVMDTSKRVVLVEDANDGKIKAVAGVDEDGNAQLIEPNEANLATLLNVNTQEAVAEAFFTKFMQEAEDPSHTGLSTLASKVFMMTEEVLSKLMKLDLDPQMVEMYQVDPAVELANIQKSIESKAQAQLTEQTPIDVEYVDVTNAEQNLIGEDTSQAQFQPMDISKIDMEDLERKGIKYEDLEPHLKQMSYYHKSNKLVEMTPEMEPGGERVQTKGRVALEEQPDGSLKAVPYYYQEKPDLDSPLHGVLLDDETKTNLLATGHAGKQVNFEIEGVQTPCYVTLDKLTNGLEVYPVSAFGKTERIKGVELTPGQQMDFESGRRITIEKMTTRAGYFRDAHVQRNASDRNFEFTFDGLDRNRYAEENKEIYRQKMAEKNTQGKDVADGSTKAKDELYIPRRIGGVEVPDWAHNNWKEANEDPSKRANVKPCYMKDIVFDSKNEPMSRWVRPNWEKGKFDFFQWKPKEAQKQGAEVKPAEESKVQAAVNNEGKTNEATKKVKEPLKQGQTAPNETQQKQVKTAPKKAKSTGKKI